MKDEELYELVATELESGQMRKGVWARAIAESDGSPPLARSLYIRFRVESLMQEREDYEAVAAAVADRERRAKEAKQRRWWWAFLWIVALGIAFAMLR